MSVIQEVTVDGGVVVAHDGSRHADEALRLGARHADALRLPLTVVRAWSLMTAVRPDNWERGYVPPLEDFEAATLAELRRTIEPVQRDHPSLAVTATVVYGHPVEKLLAASEAMDLLVVGSRGRGGFAKMLLGSVSENIVRQARCPVLVSRLRSGEGSEDVASEGSTQQDASSSDVVGGDADEILERALISELKMSPEDEDPTP